MCHHCKQHHGHECDCEEESAQDGCHCREEYWECGGRFQRRYQTKEEQISVLETYLGELKLEVQAVEERLADLRA